MTGVDWCWVCVQNGQLTSSFWLAGVQYSKSFSVLAGPDPSKTRSSLALLTRTFSSSSSFSCIQVNLQWRPLQRLAFYFHVIKNIAAKLLLLFCYCLVSWKLSKATFLSSLSFLVCLNLLCKVHPDSMKRNTELTQKVEHVRCKPSLHLASLWLFLFSFWFAIKFDYRSGYAFEMSSKEVHLMNFSFYLESCLIDSRKILTPTLNDKIYISDNQYIITRSWKCGVKVWMRRISGKCFAHHLSC